MAKKRFAVTLLSLLLISVILISTFPAFSSSASRNAADEPASQGQPITPAGSLVQDLSTRQAAVGALPVNFVRTPDKLGPDGLGRYLIAVNSGYGIQFNAAANLGQQSLSIIDLTAKPAPAVIQNVFFPSPQSANVGVVFASQPDAGSYAMYVSGGFENKVWIFQFTVDGLKRAGEVFNEWLDQATTLGISVTDAEGNAVQPIRISDLVRRYK